MNDYLSNLSALSFDRTEGIPLVSARIPSLFEPSQELWGNSVEIPSWPSVNHKPNDEIPSSPFGKVGEELKELDQATERYSGMDTAAPMSRLHRGPMEILTENGDRSPGDYKPALTALPRQDLYTVTIPQTSAKPSDHGLFEPHVRDDMKEEPATRKTTATGSHVKR